MSLNRLLLFDHYYGGLGEYALPISTHLAGLCLYPVGFPQTYDLFGGTRAIRCDEADLLEFLGVMRYIQISELDALLCASLLCLRVLLIVEFAYLAVDHVSFGRRAQYVVHLEQYHVLFALVVLFEKLHIVGVVVIGSFND